MRLFQRNLGRPDKLNAAPARELALLRSTPLLNPVWYRETYPDLRETPIDVARHFLSHGAREGRNPGPLFDTKYYLQCNPDVVAVGANPLVHFLETGAGEGRLPHPQSGTTWFRTEVEKLGPPDSVFLSHALTNRAAPWHLPPAAQPKVEVKPQTIRRRPLDSHYEVWRAPATLVDQRVCIFVAYTPDGYLPRSTLWTLRALGASGLCVVCIAASETAGPLRADDALPCEGIISRLNKGYDFGGWALGMQCLPGIWNAKWVAFANDSVFGPLNQKTLDALVNRIEDSHSDYIGLTQSWEVKHHYQSYFFALKRNSLQSARVKQFWGGLECVENREEAIHRHEVTMLGTMRDFGLATEALFPLDQTNVPRRGNPTLDNWRELVRSGFPFIKRQTLRDEIIGVDRSRWEAETSIDPELLPLMVERLTDRRESMRKSIIRRP